MGAFCCQPILVCPGSSARPQISKRLTDYGYYVREPPCQGCKHTCHSRGGGSRSRASRDNSPCLAKEYKNVIRYHPRVHSFCTWCKHMCHHDKEDYSMNPRSRKCKRVLDQALVSSVRKPRTQFQYQDQLCTCMACECGYEEMMQDVVFACSCKTCRCVLCTHERKGILGCCYPDPIPYLLQEAQPQPFYTDIN